MTTETLTINTLFSIGLPILSSIITAVVTVAKLKIHIIYIKEKSDLAYDRANEAHERINKIPHD